MCHLFNIAENTTALSHLGKQVIAISIIYSNIQWLRTQTILTSRLTKINASARKQVHLPPPLPIHLPRLHLFLFSYHFPIICFLLQSLNHYFFSHFPLFVLFFFIFLFYCFLFISYKGLHLTCTTPINLFIYLTPIEISFLG